MDADDAPDVAFDAASVVVDAASVSPDRARSCFWRSPRLPFVEVRRASGSSACYRPHAHDVLSLGAVDQGVSEVFLEGRRWRAQAGDVVLFQRNAVHACNPLRGRIWAYQMLYLDEDWVRGVLAEISSLASNWRPDLDTARSPGQIHCWLSQLSACLLGTADEESKVAALVFFAGQVFAESGEKMPSPAETSAERKHLRELSVLIAERCSDPLPLSWLAAQAGMGPYRFLRAFQAEIGMTPHAWQIDRRIVRARGLLADGMALADLAQFLGFADQSHFQRAFKARVAVAPGAYRRAVAARA